LNAYLYANGDPVNNWDPSGYETIPSQQFAQGIRGILEKVPRLLQRFRRSGRAVCKVIRAANKLQNAYATAQSAYERAQMARELAALGIAAGQQGLSGGDVMRIVFEEAFELKGLDLVRLRQFDLQDVLDTLDTPCFTAGTLVATEEGMRPIETLTMGDKVWALGQGTAELALKPITRTISREVTNTVVLTVGDERIEATAEHPFWVKDEGWIPAGMLKHGDKLRTRHGEWLSITSAELRDCAARVFNFEVKDTHTYFVGKIGTAVHNPSYREILNKTEQRAYALLQKKYPDWMPDLDAKASPRTPKQTQAARKMVKGKGHHCKPLAFGGDPNPREGLVKTGETRYKKNPTHKEVTNFWNSVLRRVRGGGR
jgi:hypothetical protein